MASSETMADSRPEAASRSSERERCASGRA